MEVVGVPDAAEVLGVSAERVRQLIYAGDLSAHRISGRWMVDRASLNRRATRVRRAGRPFAAPRAWALLALADGREPDWVSAYARHQLREVLDRRGLADLHHQLGRRAEVRRWFVHPSMVEDLVGERGVVLSGAEASGVLRSSGPAEVYVDAEDVAALERDFVPDVDAERPNLIVRVVRGPWPFAAGERRAWSAVVAADLMDHPDDERAVRAAREILADVRD